MQNNNFIRFFIIFSDSQNSGGYCKAESYNGECIFTLSLRNLSDQGTPYRLYATVKGCDEPLFISDLTPVSDCTLNKTFSTIPDNIFRSGHAVRELEAMFITDCNGNILLSGFTNRNVSEQMKHSAEQKLQSIHVPEVVNQEETDECAFDDVVDECESCEAECSTADSKNQFSSYIDTIAQLYGSITGNSNNKKPHDESISQAPTPCACDELDALSHAVSDYYTELFKCEDEFFPFEFPFCNSKWILSDCQCTPFSKYITGLVFEDDRIKYILNGIPAYINCFYVPNNADKMLWLPAKKNSDGIIGYWIAAIKI